MLAMYENTEFIIILAVQNEIFIAKEFHCSEANI